MKAVRAARWDHQARWISRTRARVLRVTTDARFRRERASVTAHPQAQAVRRLPLQEAPRIRKSFGCPKARASLKSPPRDRLRREPESRPAPRAANHQVVLLLCWER